MLHILNRTEMSRRLMGYVARRYGNYYFAANLNFGANLSNTMLLAWNPSGDHRPRNIPLKKWNLCRESPPTLQRTTKFLHTGISFYPLNNAKKLKKMTEKIKNYFNPSSFFLWIFGLKTYPMEGNFVVGKINIRHWSHLPKDSPFFTLFVNIYSLFNSGRREW